ncbi:histidine ammonia-lyase [Salinicoccus albus]|uniref:histidine ammonia-lyase n=1 Tax=Salinicoccus albus TaxID=418756 RepID=UPI000366E2F8|nr:histidine ammonia-lyase [Salinicoccus albus]
MIPKEPVVISQKELSIDELVSIARFDTPLIISNESKDIIQRSRDVVESFLFEEKTVYGITTGVGDNSTTKVKAEKSKHLQNNLLYSHASGVGNPLEKELVKAVMVMMIKNLSSGYSGIRLETVEALVNLINLDIVPKVPREGSPGYLIYQSHIALVLIGEGEAYFQGELLDGETALRKGGLTPLSLHEKEGLSLINGTVDMTAIGAIGVYDAINILKTSDVVSAISFEALKGTRYAFDKKVGNVKPHQGVKSTLSNLNTLISGSEIAEKYKDFRTQDALSIRAVPQVHGACKDTLNFVKQLVETEMNSSTDNPLIFPADNESISSANCHGESIAMSLDFLTIALSEIANISERRIFRLLSTEHSELPPFLVENSGINSGYMIPQYVAATLVSDNKRYAQPAVVDSIPTAAGQEDHISMGTSSALKLLNVIINTQRVLGIELMCGCQGLDFLKPLKTSSSLDYIYETVRAHVPKLSDDRILYNDIEKMERMIKNEMIVNHTESKVGTLSV